MSDLFMNMHQRRSNARRTPSSFNSASTNGAEHLRDVSVETVPEEDDAFANVLSLKLKKPKHWKWELTTSRSCTNIALPRILLYDHNDKLLVDANSAEEQVFKQQDFEQPSQAKREARKRTNRAVTSNLTQAVRKALDREFNGLHIQEATPSPERWSSNASSAVRRSSSAAANASIDFYTYDLPDDDRLNRRSSSLKGVRFVDEEDGNSSVKAVSKSFPIVDLPTPPSTTITSSSSGPREKRRYRRSNSSSTRSFNTAPNKPPKSILERFSFTKGRFSSPEYGEEHQVKHAPRYFLRTSKAGTLVVQEESFSRHRRRRKLKNSSSENILNDSSSKSRSTNSLRMTENSRQHQLKVPFVHPAPQSASLQNVADLQSSCRKKTHPIRRYRSDGNVLLESHLSTSEEEQNMLELNREQRKYSNFRRQSKRDLVSIDPANGVLHLPHGSPTAR